MIIGSRSCHKLLVKCVLTMTAAILEKMLGENDEGCGLLQTRKAPTY